MSERETFRVIAVNIETGERRVMKSGMDRGTAEAYLRTAVFRRGVDTEFFKIKADPRAPTEASNR